MPRQNRITPFGEIIATPERGMFLGNRGVIHDTEGHIKRPWGLKRWIVCVVAFRGRKRTVMTPGRYTELFFLDETTAFSAGHRPCAECRHQRFLDFCYAWKQANAITGARPTADEMDNRLHTERVALDRSKGIFIEALDQLPDGVFVTLEQCKGQAYLVWRDSLLAWSPGGYGERRPRPKGQNVVVLTPRSTMLVLRAGYVPEVHPSANQKLDVRE